MASDFQSIENLLVSEDETSNDAKTPQQKFSEKEKEIKLKEMERVASKTASGLGMAYISLFKFPISPEALSMIDQKTAFKNNVVCFYYDGNKIRLAVTHPNNEKAIEIMKALTKKYFCSGEFYLVSEHSMEVALKNYERLPKIRKFVQGIKIDPKAFEKFSNEINDFSQLDKTIKKVNISDIVTLLIAAAIKVGASDIHIEAEEKGVAVRFRIDGVLQEAAIIEKDKWKSIASRIKLLAKVKINITDKPQDGRFTIFLKNDRIDVRCSFLPTSFGESVVLRLLKASSVGLPFEELGFSESALKRISREIKKPNGLILTTGPTGSGKTTTLYAILKKLNSPDTKVITLEDPIEYKLDGVNQSQIDQSKNYSFAKGLRSILRQDPDVLMVGEMRDKETAEIAIQASLTGHLVLSTIHTNDASGAIPRLSEMGVKPFLLAPAINCIVGQRLVRKLCKTCREKHELSEEEDELVKKIYATISPKAGVKIPENLPQFYTKGKGCDDCNDIGYKGRVGIYEIFSMDSNIKQLASEGASSFKILEQAIEGGMLTMLQDGILKSEAGLTSLDEVFRVIGKFDYIDALYDLAISKVIGKGIKISKQQEKKGAKAIANIKEAAQNMEQLDNKELTEVLLASSIASNSSDIHIDPQEDNVRMRLRIDGILHDVGLISKEKYLPLLAKIKMLAGISTNVKKPSYDGRFSIVLESSKKKIDCRLSIISGGYGEAIVIRILASQAASLNMKDLGINDRSLEMVRSAIKKTKGIIITTGPTGSGKTTTLYSLLNKINSPDIKVITIEDPIEYHLDGIMQTQVDIQKGYTFATAMRSLMRQNPNVIMIGEIRDKETARTAIEASQTGHLVLSTIHANSATGAISRFSTLGVDRQMLTDSIEISIGQRLIRQICPNCKHEAVLDDKTRKRVENIISRMNDQAKSNIPKDLKFYEGGGCSECGGLGYKGRIGIYEVVELSEEMKKAMMNKGSTEEELEKIAIDNGTVLMMQDGVIKALSGLTTLDEVFRVAG